MTSLAQPDSNVDRSFHINKRQKVENQICGGEDGSRDSGTTCTPTIQDSWDVAFGLQEEAKQWVQQEEERSKTPYLPPGPSYKPYVSQNGKVPLRQFQEAFSECGNRYGGRGRKAKATATEKKTSTMAPSVVLVATGVSEDWEPNECMDPARFLLVPGLVASKNAKNGAALFITYMRGPEHGSVDGAFSTWFGAWIAKFPILQKYFVTGQSSGGYGHFQPDRSIFPKKKFRDRHGQDMDKAKNNLPYSRLVWEVQYKNRDPVQLRQRGKRYMSNRNTRLFLAAKFYEPDENEDYQAAIVLWGKGTASNEISVLDAVSFGTIDLSDENKNSFLEHRQDRLLGVNLAQWRRSPPLENNDGTAVAASAITIPFSGILYKVMKERQVGGNRPYLLDDIANGDIQDLTIDLQFLREQFEGILDDDKEEEEEEEENDDDGNDEEKDGDDGK